MILKPLDRLTAQQMHQRAADFAAQLGGDAIASRASKPLCRTGVFSLEELRILRDGLGQEAFKAHLIDLRNFGALCLERVLAKMDDPEADKVATLADMPRFASLPDGLVHRLRSLVHENSRMPDHVIVTVRGEDGSRYGMQCGDFRALYLLLSGDGA